MCKELQPCQVIISRLPDENKCFYIHEISLISLTRLYLNKLSKMSTRFTSGRIMINRLILEIPMLRLSRKIHTAVTRNCETRKVLSVVRGSTSVDTSMRLPIIVRRVDT